MESQIATHNDADIILKLYDLRREEVLRKARHWIVFEFNPKTPEEFLAVLQSAGSQENAYFRQVISYWEMAASLVIHGAVKSDLYLDSNGEGILVFAKFYRISRNLYVENRFSVYAPNSADDREISHGSGPVQRQDQDDSGPREVIPAKISAIVRLKIHPIYFWQDCVGVCHWFQPARTTN